MTDSQEKKATRIGPRPLGLHLGLASATLNSSLAVLPLVRDGQFSWIPELEAEAKEIQPQLREFNVEEIMSELGSRGQHLVENMLSGIRKYQTHPYKREMKAPEAIWTRGAASLLDYNLNAKKGAPIAFIVPSLINRAYILDLREGRSFTRALAENGIRPLLMDWGTPGELERGYSLDHYILELLVPALEEISKESPTSPIHLIGYCMGGTLTVAQALFQQDKLASLIALASPWNFHMGLSSAARFMLSQEKTWQTVLDSFGELPVDLLQTFFASLDPNLCINKFNLFDQMDVTGERAIEFVALEDWLNDGVPLVPEVAKACFAGWYGENQPHNGNWSVDGKNISPGELTIPTMIAVPKSDKIVPPGSALGLAEQVPNATVYTPPSGHIGMVAGSRAKTGLWADVIQWINQ